MTQPAQVRDLIVTKDPLTLREDDPLRHAVEIVAYLHLPRKSAP